MDTPSLVQCSMRTTLSTVTTAGRPQDLQLSRAWSQDSEERLFGAMGEPRGEPSKFQDSSIISGDYSEELGAHCDFDIDAMRGAAGQRPGVRRVRPGQWL